MKKEDLSDFSDIIVEDSENYRNNPMGIKEIAMEQYRNCCKEGSKEMTKGGIKNKLVGHQIIPIEVENQREIFMNTVEMLEITLLGAIEDVKDSAETMKKIDNKIKKVKEDCNKRIKQFSEKNKELAQGGSKKRVGEEEVVRCKDDAEMELVKLFKAKLCVLSKLLKMRNYFGEIDG